MAGRRQGEVFTNLRSRRPRRSSHRGTVWRQKRMPSTRVSRRRLTAHRDGEPGRSADAAAGAGALVEAAGYDVHRHPDAPARLVRANCALAMTRLSVAVIVREFNVIDRGRLQG